MPARLLYRLQKVKQVVAVEAPPKFKERAKSWEYDMKKLVSETMKKLKKLVVGK